MSRGVSKMSKIKIFLTEGTIVKCGNRNILWWNSAYIVRTERRGICIAFYSKV